MIRTLALLVFVAALLFGCTNDEVPVPEESDTETVSSGEAEAAISIYDECLQVATEIKGNDPQLEKCYELLQLGKSYLEQDPPRYMQASEVLNLIYNSNESGAKNPGTSHEFFQLIYMRGEAFHQSVLENLNTWVVRLHELEEEAKAEFYREELFPRFAGQSHYARGVMIELASLVEEEEFFHANIDTLYEDWEER